MRSAEVKNAELIFKRGQDHSKKSGFEIARNVMHHLKSAEKDGASHSAQVFVIVLYLAGILNDAKQFEVAVEFLEKLNNVRSKTCCENHGGAQ